VLSKNKKTQAGILAIRYNTCMVSQTRIDREARTLSAMLRLYCRHQHGTGTGLCPDCHSLQDYALLRLKKCPFQEGKTTCARCPVHCYTPDRREEIRQVMRFSGPRMLFAHPWLTVLHLFDSLRKEPVKPPRH
jgi:hypothetical protein